MRLRLIPKSAGLGRLPYAWLAFLGFFVAGMFISPITATNIVISIAGLGVFLVFYFRAFWISDGPGLLLPIGIFSLLGVGLSFINPGAAVFFQYAGFFSGRLGNWRFSIAVAALILLLIVATWYALDRPLQFLLSAGLVTAALAAMSMQIFAAERLQRQLTRSQAEVEQLATIAERERIARDLHDVVGHTLSVISTKSELAHRLFSTDPEKSRQEIVEVEDIARNALDEVRQTISGYKHLGLQKEIANLCGSMRSAGIDSQFEQPEEPVVVPAQHETTLIKILKEAITNVIRHANAKSCRIRLEAADSNVVLTVHDDGVGYANQTGSGLDGMTEHVKAIGGSVSISSQNGTLLIASLPRVQA